MDQIDLKHPLDIMPEDTILSFSPSSIDLKQPLVCLISLILSLSFLALRRLLLLLLAAAGGGGRSRPGRRLESRCTVCLDDILCVEGKLKVLPKCGHVFHAECVDRWLKCRRTCPLCQRAVAEQHNRSFKERLFAAVLWSFCQCVDRLLDSELTILFCHHM